MTERKTDLPLIKAMDQALKKAENQDFRAVPRYGLLGLSTDKGIKLDETVKELLKSPLSKQIGGDHYKNFKIQPIEFITRNSLSFLQGNIIKRICRFNLKGGKGIEDLEKIKHEVDLLIELEEVEKAA